MTRLHTFGEYPSDWPAIAKAAKDAAEWRCIRCQTPHGPVPNVLTTHHWDGDKGNCRWWNLLALCQRCHLQIQGKVNPDRPWVWEHSEWFKPYVAAFYAFRYLNEDLTRDEVAARLGELLELQAMVTIGRPPLSAILAVYR